MELRLVPRLRPTSKLNTRSSSALSSKTLGRSVVLTASALAMCVAATHAQAETPQGKTVAGVPVEVIPAPKGYPSDLRKIPAGQIVAGISAKDLQAVAKECCNRSHLEEARICKLLGRELGQEKVQVPGFFIGATEVTNEQYESYVKANWPNVRFPFSWWKQENIKKHRDAFYKVKENRGKNFDLLEYWRLNFDKLEWKAPQGDDGKKPVTYVSYKDAQGYCAWAGLRLPTEFEWQRAYQGNSDFPYLLGKKWDPEWKNILQVANLRQSKVKPVASVESNVSPYGIYDMMGNVWEWTMSPYSAYDMHKRFVAKMKSWSRRQGKRNADLLKWTPPYFDSARRVARGGSYQNAVKAPLVFRVSTRMPLSMGQTVESLGFRVAKSLKPGFDSTILWARRRFNTASLGDAALDLPDTQGLRMLSKGKASPADYDQLGIERWDLDGKKIKGHHLISFIPVKEALGFTKDARAWGKQITMDGKDGAHGSPILAVFSTEAIQVKRGLEGPQDLDAGLYTVEFHGAGLPFELQQSMREGSGVLRLFKGKRPSEEQLAQQKEKAKKALEKKKKRAKKNGRKKGKKAKKLTLDLHWTEMVDKYQVADETTRKYPKKKPEEITIQPGNLRIPTDKDILLVRDHKRGYVAWMPYRKQVRKIRLSGRTGRPELEVNRDTGRVTYFGGPRVGTRHRVLFQVPLYFSVNELIKNWTSPHGDVAIASGVKRAGKKSKVHAKPRKGSRND